jgi:hypothetical protein
METPFRDILKRFLEEKSPLSEEAPRGSSPSPSEIPSEFSFHWRPDPSRPSPAKLDQTARYPKSPPRTAAPMSEAAKPAPLKESIFALEQLESDVRRAADNLIRLGASELNEGLSRRRLRQAHRRLAKRWHPDRLSPAASLGERESARLKFMEMQIAYESLSDWLENRLRLTKINSACDNESVSAQDRRHRDVA